ncbi:transmembrane protein [Rhynchospora pubera]|nr:transmembrane protein [Rhynchospora pubera]KAJ4783724.1 transmembrane protein [Rhynchospora pubera]
MTDKGAEEVKVAPAEPAVVGLVDRLQEQWRKTKEHAETYPYVWGSYILVYSGLGAYLTWRWRKLRRTEDRVRALQERLKKLVEADEAKKPSSGL